MRHWPILLMLGCLSFQFPQISRSQTLSTEIWALLKEQLSGSESSQYFENGVKGAILPVLLEEL
jgi:hypothetical protein